MSWLPPLNNPAGEIFFMNHMLPNDGPGMPSSTNMINVRFDFLPPVELKIKYENNDTVLKISGLDPDKGRFQEDKFTVRNAKSAAPIVQK